MTFRSNDLQQFDPKLAAAIEHEKQRQDDHLELIASENYASVGVMQAQGSVLTNKYAEGYPGKRYYGGCEYVDIAENLAIERACKLFNCKYANVQPHSGSQANAAVFLALLNPGDTILGMGLNAGGHLTHGTKVNFSGQIYKAISYDIDKNTGLINYDNVAQLAREHKPKLIIAGFSAYPGVVDWKKFREIADSVGAYLLVDMAHVAGLVATGLYPSPIEYADVVTSTTHKTLRGPRGGLILSNKDAEFTKKFNTAIFPGSQGGPLMHIIAAKAVAFLEALQPDFVEYQKQVLKNSKKMAEVFIKRGYNIVAGGTENHLIVVDLSNQEYSGKDAEQKLDQANITVNKNCVPNETRSPFVTSGLRLGTPAITTRGFKEAEIETITNWICDILDNIDDEKLITDIKNKVIALCNKFPVYNQ
jgi:glycine hydroxymethyltransferase